MVSTEQRWNESKRERNRASQVYQRALRARNSALVMSRVRWSSNIGLTNRERTQMQQRAQANFNRARQTFNIAKQRMANAHRNLRLKYHLPNHPHLNNVLRNLVRNKKANVRHRVWTHVLSAPFPPNVAREIARLVN